MAVRRLAVAGQRVGLVVLADADQPLAVAIDDEVGEPPRSLRGDRLEHARRDDAVQAPGLEVGDDDEVAVDEVGGAAVLVDAGPGVEAVGRQAGQRPSAVAPPEDLAAVLLGPALEPPADAAGGLDLAEGDDAGGQQRDRERRVPARRTARSSGCVVDPPRSRPVLPGRDVLELLGRHRVERDPERRQLEAGDLGIDRLRHDVDLRRRARRGAARRTPPTAPGWRSSCPSPPPDGPRRRRGSRAGPRR